MPDSTAQHVRTGTSRIAGRGLFAAAPIAAGTGLQASAANHGCDPNLWWSGGELVALRDIAAGEELTFDYATGAPSDYLAPDGLLRCNCGSTRCRGLIEDGDWRIPELQHRYAGHWWPDRQRQIDRGE